MNKLLNKIAIVLLALILTSNFVTAEEAQTPYRGWEYIVDKLLKDGIDPKVIDRIYLSPKMPALDIVYFKLKPKEASSIYAGFKDKKLIQKAAEFLKSNRPIFEAAEKVHSVSRNVICAIMLVETRLGANTGKNLIINRLSRVGSIAKPENVLINYHKIYEDDPKVAYKDVFDRAKYLEDRFYPEVLALLKMSHDHHIDLLELQGSFAGAFGIPQFLPSTFLNYAVDGNGDGITSLFNNADAIFSIANYLKHSGWKDEASRGEKESVIWQYNHSDPYIDTVLYIAGELGKETYEPSK